MIFIFIDGFGIGQDSSCTNPIVAANTPCFEDIFKKGTVIPTDPCLDIPGLPQSATGQTAIFTGVNASKVLNRHLHGQPTITLKNVINKNNLFKELLKRNLTVTNANVYRDEYLQKIFDQSDRRVRPSVTTVMSLSCDIKLRTVRDFKEGNGVYHDITGKILVESNYLDDVITPENAAKRLCSISQQYDFTLFEIFITDIAGHKMDMGEAIEVIELLDVFIGKVAGYTDLEKDTIFITSDHGNIEDITVKTHTFNKVPTIILGRQPDKLYREIKSLTDILPAVIEIFERSYI